MLKCSRQLRRHGPAIKYIIDKGKAREVIASLSLPCRARRLTTSTSVPTSSSLATHSSETRPASQRTAESPRLPPVNITPPVTTYPPPHVTEYKPVPVLTPTRLLKAYSQLSKTRLTTLMTLTAMAGVALSPLPATIPVLLGTAVGTALCSASANAINQIVEVPFDAQMPRTRNRPLVRRIITPLHAAGFAAVSGVAGPAILLTMVNPFTAALGAFNIFLYAGVYTPLKRIHVVNTWVGAVVGAIPPVMGWTACNGHVLPTSAHPLTIHPPPFLADLTAIPSSLLAHTPDALDNPLSALALFLLLFSWQFPHFNALSRMVRTSYAQGGYKMLSVTNPDKNTLVSLRHTILLGGICSILTPLAGLTTWTFAVTSLIPNAIFLRSAWRFRRTGGEKEARRLFHDSLWWLPVIMGLMMFHKQGITWMEWLGLKDGSAEEPVAKDESTSQEGSRGA